MALYKCFTYLFMYLLIDPTRKDLYRRCSLATFFSCDYEQNGNDVPVAPRLPGYVRYDTIR